MEAIIIVKVIDDHFGSTFQLYYSGNFNCCQLSEKYVMPFCVSVAMASWYKHHGINSNKPTESCSFCFTVYFNLVNIFFYGKPKRVQKDLCRF